MRLMPRRMQQKAEYEGLIIEHACTRPRLRSALGVSRQYHYIAEGLCCLRSPLLRYEGGLRAGGFFRR